jgi:serine/threonine-protein kinase
VKVADFGIAHIESSSLTQVGTVMGTPSYMSPEQIMGLPVDGRSDLFSAGVILYQFLTGERPFAGSATTTMQKVLKEDPLPPSTLNVQLPPGMDAVVRKGLAKRADDRYQTAREFSDAIRVASAAAASPAPALHSDPTIVAAPAADGIAPARPEAMPLRTAAPAAGRSTLSPALAVVAAIALVAVGAGGWFIYQWRSAETARTAQPAIVPSTSAPAGSAPAQPIAAAKSEPGTLVISAVGLVDPSDPRYQNDKVLLQSDLRADSRSQLVEKAVGLLLDTRSVAKNYDLLRDRVLSKSGEYIKTVVRESEPRTGKDGLVSITTEAVVNVKAVQKSLNQMSRDERVDLIRASGDPKVSVQISVRDADRPDVPPLPSPVAENILKERIRSFGFRTWAEGAADGGKGPDFAVLGEAALKRLSARLEASGLVVTKYALTSWTVKCVDRETGEEIYFNTALPTGVGSWPSEEEALKAIGAKIADEFSRDFFLQHASVTSQKVALYVDGMPDAASEELLARELIGLPDVVTASARPPAKPRAYDLQLAGAGSPGDLVANGVLKPLNAKLGQSCFALGSVGADQVSVTFDPRCADASVLNKLETNPPAGLYSAPPGRQRAVVKNPEMLRKLAI